MRERIERPSERAKRQAAQIPASEINARGRVVRSRRTAPIQAKLEVGPADDRYEREADAVAAQVVQIWRSPAPSSLAVADPGRTRRAGTTPPEPASNASPASRIQRMAGIGLGGGTVDAETEREVRGSSGGGRPLPDHIRTSAETAFGADFGHVRVHDGPRATAINDRIQAKAFTTGGDIHFRDGLPDTNSRAGQHLLAHELTHTIQQGASGSGAQRTVTVQRFLDPSQRQKLASTEQKLKALFQTPKGKGKAAKSRKQKIADLRATIAELQKLDAQTPDPSAASGASIITPSTTPQSDPQGESDEVVDGGDEAQVPTASEPSVVIPQATDPSQQATLEKKVKQLASVQEQDESTMDARAAKKRSATIARLTRQIAALTAPGPEKSATGDKTIDPPGQTDDTPKASGTASGNATQSETTKVDPPEEKGPDLAAVSLRDKQADLAEHAAKGLPAAKGKSRSRYNKRTRMLEAEVAELEAAIAKAYPELNAAIGSSAAQELANEFEDTGVAQLRSLIPDKRLKTLCEHLRSSQLRALADAYDIPTMWVKIQAWGDTAVADLLTEYSAAEIKVLEARIGAPRFTDLIANKRLTAAAIKYYPTNFLKTFAGATDATWAHLIDIKYNAKGGISGGHDKAVFDAFAEREGVQINSRRSLGSFEKVSYTTFDRSDNELETGSKTLIPSLGAKKAKMLAAVNEALWHAIAEKNFDVGRADWYATTRDNSQAFSGFYRNGKIDTFFPES